MNAMRSSYVYNFIVKLNIYKGACIYLPQLEL